VAGNTVKDIIQTLEMPAVRDIIQMLYLLQVYIAAVFGIIQMVHIVATRVGSQRYNPNCIDATIVDSHGYNSNSVDASRVGSQGCNPSCVCRCNNSRQSRI